MDQTCCSQPELILVLYRLLVDLQLRMGSRERRRRRHRAGGVQARGRSTRSYRSIQLRGKAGITVQRRQGHKAIFSARLHVTALTASGPSSLTRNIDMPAKVPFLSASESLRQRWQEAATSQRVSAQVYVFSVLIAVGFLHHYVFGPASRKRLQSNAKPNTYGSSSAGAAPGAKDETVGVVDGIYIYPIKSCAGVPVSAADLTVQGFLLDRRWMVVAKSKQDETKLGKISLREEPKLTLIQPQIDEDNNILRLKISDRVTDTVKTLGETSTVLHPTPEQLQGWKLLPKVEMYGDFADGRVAELAPNAQSKGLAPSEWISEVSCCALSCTDRSLTAFTLVPGLSGASDPL